MIQIEDVPVHFGEATIRLAFTAWLMGAVGTNTKDEAVNTDVVGQLLAILIGRRIALEGEGRHIGTAALLRDFATRVKDQVSKEEYALIAGYDATSFDAFYAEIMSQAKAANIAADELADALQNISVVRLYAKRFLKES